MSRTPENENIIRNENQTSYNDMQKSLGQYESNIGTLSRGGAVGANPYETPSYLADQNKLVADATSGANSAAKQQLELQNRRSGGQNTGATNATVANLALGKMRLGNQELTQQRAQDYGKNLQWQQYLAGAPLNVANAQEGVANASIPALSNYALAQQKEWYNNINQGLQAVDSGVNAAGGAITGA